MDLKGMVMAGALATTLTTSLVAAQTATSDASARQYVRTSSGVVHGRNTGNVVEFLGVPFAAPPIGDLRWRAPQPAAHWEGVREATIPSNGCVRPAKNSDGYQGNEDCLYLNVYRPANTRPSQARLPVMVFVHGGSNLKQAASDYDPVAFVEQTGVVLVTTDYRLNVFGFLALPSLDTEAGDTSSGNFGLQDQQAALKWVLANIAHF